MTFPINASDRVMRSTAKTYGAIIRTALLLEALLAFAANVFAATIEVRNARAYGPWPQVKTWTLTEVCNIAALPGFVASPEPARDRFGGRTDVKLAATGFFRVERIGHRWWLVTPEGHPCLSPGINNVGQNVLGSTKEEADAVARFGSIAAWAEATLTQLRDLGVTSLSSDGKSLDEMKVHAALLQAKQRLPWTMTWQLLPAFGQEYGLHDATFKGTGQGDPKANVPICLPVFNPDFAAFCDEYVRAQVATVKDDPFLIGYFTDNELPNSPDTLDRVLRAGPADHLLGTAYQPAVDWLSARRGAAFDPKQSILTDLERIEFLGFVFDRYYAITSAAIRRHDPHHLCLGSRLHKFAVQNPAILAAADRHLDVISVNFYGTPAPAAELLALWRKASNDRPFIITEFYAMGDDLSFDNTNGDGWIVRTQADRGRFYENFVLRVLESGNVVSWQWFKHRDASKHGSNKGLLDSDHSPYAGFSEIYRRVNHQVYQVAEWFDQQRQPPAETNLRWPPERIAKWMEGRSVRGFNYNPRTAVNDIEQWQAATFDVKTIDEEFGWAENIGFNSVRVFLSFTVWQADVAAFRQRFAKFLEMAQQHGLSVMPVLFSDGDYSGKVGPQPDPITGVHNSRAVVDPGVRVALDPQLWPPLRPYVLDMVGNFANDERIIAWDVYNEPGNSSAHEKVLPLVEQVFEWAREGRPMQPLTAGPWLAYDGAFSQRLVALSDLVTFHNYEPPEKMAEAIRFCARAERPVLCTEWLCRQRGNTLQAILPVFKQHQVGWYQWGLVSGKTQTYMPWDSKPNTPMPAVWQHDLLHSDGTPYDAKELELLRRASREKTPSVGDNNK